MIDQLLKLNIPMNFTYYFKYQFSFKAQYNHYEITGTVGGSADDIYRFELSPDKPILLSKDHFNSITVKNTLTGEEDNWSDY